MKCEIIIGTEHEESVIIYARERTKLVEEIESFVLGYSTEIIGYKDKSAVVINPAEVCCFTVEDGKTYALTDDDKLLLKSRLYQVEKILSDNFIKINQSCIANIKKISRFDVIAYGSLAVIFKNGHRDYVSRRQIKSVKERLGV